MENICLRMPHILEQINELLDDKSLVKCKGVSRMTCSIIEHQTCGKFVTIRVIQSYFKNPQEFAKDWRIVFRKLSLERLNELAILVKDFYKAVPSRIEENWSPMHIVAERGHLDFCKGIAKLSSTIKSYEWPPLNFSVQEGHLEVTKFLYQELKDKKGRRIFEIMLHLATENGHLKICKFLHENSNGITPLMQEGITPLHLAAQYGHFEVCKYICLYKELADKKERRIFEIMQHLAAKNGHLEIYKFLYENLNTINPLTQEDITPLHLAAQYGHFEVCKYICDINGFAGPLRSDENTPFTLAFHRGHIKIARLLYERDVFPHYRPFVDLMCKQFCMFLCFFIVFDTCLLYPLFGSSTIFHAPMLSIIFIIFFCPPMPLAVGSIAIILNILNDLWFCFGVGSRTSPKLDF
jgi:ankyrin repeat protein